MTATTLLHPPSYREGDLLTSAERELGAFMSTIRQRYGLHSAEAAGDRWVTELERADWHVDGLVPDWRRITIRTLETLFALRLLPLHAVENS